MKTQTILALAGLFVACSKSEEASDTGLQATPRRTSTQTPIPTRTPTPTPMLTPMRIRCGFGCGRGADADADADGTIGPGGRGS